MLFAGLVDPNFPVYFSADASEQTVSPDSLECLFLDRSRLLFVFEKARDAQSRGGEKTLFFVLLNFYLASNSAAILSDHFGMYWVAAEATTLSVAPLIYFYRNEESLEAMWKYLFLVSVGIAFAFIGILLLALSAKETVLEEKQLFFRLFIRNAALLNPIWLKASFIFIFVGLSTKIGIAPMHSADVDATSNAPSPIAALMSGSLRITALLGRNEDIADYSPNLLVSSLPGLF